MHQKILWNMNCNKCSKITIGPLSLYNMYSFLNRALNFAQEPKSN